MRNIPFEVLLSWPAPNHDNPENRIKPVIIITSVIIPLCVITVLARLYSRTFILRTFGLDDWMIIPAAITGVGYCVCAIEGIWHGWYIHIWDNPVSKVVEARKLVVALSFLAILNAGFTKLSVLLLYCRVFPSSSLLRKSIYVLLVITIGWMIALTVANFLLCIPLQAYWQVLYTGEQKCLDELPYFVLFAATDLALDTVIYILPLPRAISLSLPSREKRVVVGIFCFGILTIASAAARLPLLLRASESYDLTWELFGAAIWTEVEIFVGIFCASAPALKPLVVHYAPALLDSLASTAQSRREGSQWGSGGVVEIVRPASMRYFGKSKSVIVSQQESDVMSYNPPRNHTSASDFQFFDSEDEVSDTRNAWPL